jgi:type I restriction enzyme R subunit
LARTFIKVYGELSPDPAILDFTAEVKWAAGFLKVAAQVIDKDQSVDHRSYTGKIRDMLEEHVHATGLSTTIKLRSITDPNFTDDFDAEGKTEEDLVDAFVRKSAELKRVTRELVDKNPAQYGRFSERVLEIIRRFEEGQIAAAEGLKEYEDLTGGIQAEKGAHADLGMDENGLFDPADHGSIGARCGPRQPAGRRHSDRRSLCSGPARPALLVLHGWIPEGPAEVRSTHPARKWGRGRSGGL